MPWLIEIHVFSWHIYSIAKISLQMPGDLVTAPRSLQGAACFEIRACRASLESASCFAKLD
jgi:hypothetical protein